MVAPSAPSPAMDATGTKRAIDWEAMEPLWRAGVVSVSRLSADFEVSRPAIQKHWAKRQVTRDLSGKIRAEADAIVARAEVRAERLQQQVAARDPVTDAETVSTNAQIQAAAILAERRDVRRFRDLADSLFNELVVATAQQDDKAAAKQDAQRKSSTLSSRIDSTKKLAETMKILFALERQVLNIVDDTPVDPAARVAEAVESGLEGLKAAFAQKLGRTSE